jgi:hypothetical protein
VRPAAHCGTRAEHRTLPRVGRRSDGRTQIGPLASSIDALEQALAVLAGPDGRDPAAAPVPLPPSAPADLRGLRIAVTTGEGAWQAAPHVADAVRRAGAVEVVWEFEWWRPAVPGADRDHRSRRQNEPGRAPPPQQATTPHPHRSPAPDR